MITQRIINYLNGIMIVYPKSSIYIANHTEYTEGLCLNIKTLDGSKEITGDIFDGLLVSEEAVIDVLKDILVGRLDKYIYKQIPKACIDLLDMDNLYISTSSGFVSVRVIRLEKNFISVDEEGRCYDINIDKLYYK